MEQYNNDFILTQEFKRGNHKAFEFIYKKYFKRLKGFGLRYIKDEDIVQDIVQECFINLWEKRITVQSVSVPSFLFAMVRNSCMNHIKHEIVVQKFQLEFLAASEGEERLYSVDFGLEAEHKLLYEELKEQITLVVDQLPDRCRQVFILSRFEGLKNREIADQLQISTTAVEKHLAKAMQRFSIHFKDKYPIE
ncbi:MAG: RNA polymerase sigma-70 factor, partial [Bacteroidales bacterium]